MNKFKLLFSLALCAVLSHAQAGQESGYRNLREYGCNKGYGACFVYLEGAAVSGGPSCTSNLLRWNGDSEINGKTWLALIIAAKISGKKVNFYVNGCLDGYPTFEWGLIES